MTNPHPATPTNIDIRAMADQVIAQLRMGRHADAIRLLETARDNERPVVQEALDRYVAVEARDVVGRLGRPGAVEAEILPVVERLQAATKAPRMPAHNRSPGEPNEFVGLTGAQSYDVYASIVEARGDQSARDALALDHHSVLLGLRRENPTMASGDGRGRAGTGVYDDRIVVLTRADDGERSVFIADRASTEPTAQYSHHAGSNGTRPLSGPGGREETRLLAPSPGYEGVTRPRKIEGEDVDGDSMRDLGRLAEGTVEMVVAEHPNPRSVGMSDAFRPSRTYLDSDRSAGMVQRDTNADGYFTAADPHGIQDLNPSFKIHSGSRNNTDSAGCQTIHPDDYRGFINAARINPGQTRWQYVLTATEDGLFRNVQIGTEPSQPAARPPVERVEPANRQGKHGPVTRSFRRPGPQPLPCSGDRWRWREGEPDRAWILVSRGGTCRAIDGPRPCEADAVERGADRVGTAGGAGPAGVVGQPACCRAAVIANDGRRLYRPCVSPSTSRWREALGVLPPQRRSVEPRLAAGTQPPGLRSRSSALCTASTTAIAMAIQADVSAPSSAWPDWRTLTATRAHSAAAA